MSGKGKGRITAPGRVAGETRLGMQSFGEAYGRGEAATDEDHPVTVVSQPNPARMKVRQATDRDQ
ncbi:hypothetical protein JJC00_07850 [Bradyrhizobium diazoefficiens]|uniref:hypothetical protein n=1 Tax=Bradyrhizobium diazoefficiens TaxID=1355477 RepID=UPI001909B758|nr:hypothetical protein [Bradyrhizobium diazoefficiens]QQO35533.1 hypothetical protein JJC00_07850 [Bradyrhizobium diazoefficiens]